MAAQHITDEHEAAQVLKDLCEQAGSAVFFGGAGVSVASGIPDFRSEDGLYHQKFAYPPEYMLSHEFFEAHTAEFYDFYRERMLALDARPNQAHKKLAELEARGNLRAVVTQNIDGLHQAAGSRAVFELHGSVLRNRCTHCGKAFGVDVIIGSTGVPTCDTCGGVIKPDVVLYGEGLDQATLEGSVRAIAAADLLIIGGTSLVVYPAAGLVDYFAGNTLVVVNREATPADARADVVICADIARAFDFLW